VISEALRTTKGPEDHDENNDSSKDHDENSDDDDQVEHLRQGRCVCCEMPIKIEIDEFFYYPEAVEATKLGGVVVLMHILI
jgi:hypothetical protein